MAVSIKNDITTRFKTEGARKTQKETEGIGRAQTRLGQASASAGRSFSAQATGLGGLVGVYAAAAANVFAITAAFEALGRAAQAEQIIKGTKTLALEIGQSGASILKSVQEITQSQLTLAEAAQNINIALSAGFNSDQIEALSEVSLKASKALGRNLTDAFQRVVRGASKLEPELLDELGIFTRIDPAVAAYASKLNIATNSLTNFEKRQAFVNAIIEEGNRKFSSIDVTTASAQKSLEQLQAGLTELALQFGQLTANFLVPLVDFIKNNAGVALLAFLGILQLVFGRLFAAVGGFAVGKLEGMTRFFDGLVAGAQRSEKAMKNVSAAVEDFNKNIKERGGVLGRGATDKTLAGTGGFTGVGLTQSQASDAAQARRNFLAGGATGQQQEKDIKALTEAQKKLTAAGKQNTLAFQDTNKILSTYQKQIDGASKRTKAFTAITRTAAAATSVLSIAVGFAGKILNGLFLIVAGAQLIGTFFDVDLLGKLKGLFFDLSQAAENLKTGLQGVATSAAGGPVELEKTLKRLGATDEDLKNLGKTFSSIFDEAAETASRFANANGRAKRNADNLLKTVGSSITQFKESGVVQQQIIALTIQENKLKKENTAESRRQLAIVQSLIQGLKELGGAQEIIGAVSRQLNLSSSKTADIFKKIATVNDDGVIKFKALGIEVDGTKLKFQDLSKETQDLIESNVLAQNTIDAANDAFEAGAANAETLSKKLGGLNTQIKKLKGNRFGDPEEIKVLEDQAELIKQRVRDLKTLEGIGKALDKTYGKYGNTLDTAVAKGLVGLNGIAKDSNEVAKNQVAFLKSAIGFSGENVQAIKDAIKEEKETGKLNSKQVELLKNRTKALKAVAGIAIELTQNIEKETRGREKILENLKSSLSIQRKQLDIQKLQNRLQLTKEQQQTQKETSEALLKNFEFQAKFLEAGSKAREEQVQFEIQLLQITRERARIEQDTANIRSDAALRSDEAGRRRNIASQQSRITDLSAFPNLVMEETLLAERKKLSDLTLGNELQLIFEREELAKRNFEREKSVLNDQIDVLEKQEAGLVSQLNKQTELQKKEQAVRDKQQAIENQAFKDQKANIDIQEKISLQQFNLAKLQVEADKKKFELDNKNFERQLEALRTQQQIVQEFQKAVSGDSPFVKAITEFLTEQGVDKGTIKGITDATIKATAVDFTGLENLQKGIKKVQDSVLSTKLDAAGEKFKSTNDVLAEQFNRIDQLAELTKKRQGLENSLANFQNQTKNDEIENKIKIKQEEIKNVDATIEKIKAKYDAEKSALKDERALAKQNSDERIKAFLREQDKIKQTANRIAGVVNQGLSDAVHKAFDNLRDGASLGEGLRDIFVSTLDNVRKVVLEETLIKPLQNEVSGFIGGLFGIDQKGADNAGLVGDALKTFVVNSEGQSIGAEIAEKGNSIFKTIGDKLSEFGTNAMDTFSKLGTSIMDAFSNIGSSIMDSFSGIGGGGGGSILSAFGSGGMFGSQFEAPMDMVVASGGRVPKMAAGGRMKRDRVPALLEPGEFVMKRSSARSIGEANLNSMNATGQMGGNVSVNIVNQGTPQEATQQSEPRFDGEKFIIDIVTRDLRNNGPIRKSLRGAR